MKTKLALWFTLVLALTAQAQVSPPDAVIDGRTIPEWTAEWWKWVYAQSTNASALFDTDGSQATNGQPGGSVFFVANIATPGRATRTFTVREGSYLLFPVRYVTLDNLNFPLPLTAAELRDTAAGVVDLMTNLHVTIDGQSIDVSSHRVFSPVFNFDFQSPDNLDSFFNGVPVTGLVDPIVSDGYWIMVQPLAAGPHVINFGGDIGPPYNSSKDITDSITVVPANHPPIADASATRLRYIAARDGSARVVLDGSRSSDPDSDTLNFLWLENGATVATGTVSTAVLNIGTHQISLVVSDGSLTATNTITVHVITAAEAVRDLALQVRDASVPSKYKHPLVEPLEDASEAFHRGHFAQGIKHLREFEEEVREHVASRYSAIAQGLAQSAQEIIDAVGQPAVASSPAIVLPNDSNVDGKSLSEWTAEWFKWTWLQPTNIHPSLDLDGRWAANGQSDRPVFFLTGVFGDLPLSTEVVRSFSVPEGRYLFFPLLAVTWENIDAIPPATIQELRDAGAAALATTSELHATIDGISVPDMFQHRLMSPVYSYILPDANNLKTVLYGHPISGLIDPEIADGYWVMVEPLAPGVHVLNWGGSLDLFNYRQNITAIITIVPIPLPQRIEELISSVTAANLPPKRQHDLLHELQQAEEDFQSYDFREGIEDMAEFQKKVRREVAPIDSALADELIQPAQTIIDKAKAQTP